MVGPVLKKRQKQVKKTSTQRHTKETFRYSMPMNTGKPVNMAAPDTRKYEPGNCRGLPWKKLGASSCGVRVSS